MEHDFGWALETSEASRIDSVRVNGRRFYARRQWSPTSLSYSTDADTSMLRDVYVNGVRFARAPGRDFDDVDQKE